MPSFRRLKARIVTGTARMSQDQSGRVSMFCSRLMGLVMAVAVLWAGPAWPADVPAGELLRLLDLAEKQYAQIQDYTSTMVSRERVGEVLRPQERVLLKFQRPFKVYMRWLDGPSKGREGLFVSGAHDDKFLVSEPRGISAALHRCAGTHGPPGDGAESPSGHGHRDRAAAGIRGREYPAGGPERGLAYDRPGDGGSLPDGESGRSNVC